MHRASVVAGTAVATVVAVAVTACAAPAPETVPSVDPSKCTKESLGTLYSGILTFGADQPVYPPWYMGDDPANGEGFESALAYAVAGKLSYAPDDVRWVRVTFNAALTPGAKPFDANLSQFSITDQRRAAVDFSSPYFDVTQAVLTVRTSPAAAVHTLAGLGAVRLGAQVGTTSYTAASSVAGAGGMEVYNTNVDAKMALVEGRIDALVADLPTAFAVANELPDGVIVGQFPTVGDGVEQLGIVLDHGSPLTRCVSWAVDTLRDDGTLDRLKKRWLADAGRAPVLS
ncbi:ABC transporter substrate-binding protein [Mycobacterium sp. Y57]|uniref:ABC transporter substrate-binding protein n=1 Tax=Mycolicibacterium xanthum TaxID=2796469 RepID=UPI001C864943|nr:ABC transporter substrate-binding protein [Mycolicibacterium xanthum]MBX7432323.1 ABC transporter substrate-binding protein [Mycolicibacterium xanthum]